MNFAVKKAVNFAKCFQFRHLLRRINFKSRDLSMSEQKEMIKAHQFGLANAHPTSLSDSEKIKQLLRDYQIEFVDLRFTDLRGKEHHVTLPKDRVDDGFFQNGKAFDGSSLCG